MAETRVGVHRRSGRTCGTDAHTTDVSDSEGKPLARLGEEKRQDILWPQCLQYERHLSGLNDSMRFLASVPTGVHLALHTRSNIVSTPGE